MDEAAESGPYKGKTLLQLWQSDPSSRTPQAWTTFYDSFDPKMRDKSRGALPFRVMQLYDIMVAAVKKKSLSRYICAAGLLAHYVGDACQPLHVSHLHHGYADDSEDDKVHSVYETSMLDRFRVAVVAGVNSEAQKVAKAEVFKGAEEAADAVVQLMRRTVKELPPEDVIESFNRHKGNQQTVGMWEELGDLTIERMADGAHTLALIWQSAWTEGGGDKSGHIATTALKPISKAALKKLYEDKTFAESLWLREM